MSIESAAPASSAAVRTASDPAAPPTRAHDAQPTTVQKPGQVKRPWLPLLLLVALAALGGGWWVAHRGLESTDDAALDGDIIAVSTRVSGTVSAVHFKDNQRVEAGAVLVELDQLPAEARLARAQADVLAAQASASAARAAVALTEETGAAGQDIARASLTGAAVAVTATDGQIAEARAALSAANALRSKTALDRKRAENLLQSGSISSAELEGLRADDDRAQAAVEQAQARIATLQSSTSQARARVNEASARLSQAQKTWSPQLAQAQAELAAAEARVTTATADRDLAKLELSYTHVVAPRAGIVSRRSVSPGQVVAAGQGLVMLSPDPSHEGTLWVTGNFKETQLEHMRVGQPARVMIDAYGRELGGHVQSFSGATGSRFALLPPDNASGNFTKVVQRVPVRVTLDAMPDDVQLLPGLSVELTVDTRL